MSRVLALSRNFLSIFRNETRDPSVTRGDAQRVLSARGPCFEAVRRTNNRAEEFQSLVVLLFFFFLRPHVRSPSEQVWREPSNFYENIIMRVEGWKNYRTYI